MGRPGSNVLAEHFDCLCHDADAARAIILRLGVRADTTNPGVCVSPHSRGNADGRWHVILFSRRHFRLLRLCALEPASKGGTPAAFPGKGLKTGVPLATARVLGQTRRRKTYAQKSGSFLASLLAIKDRERDPSPVEAAAP